MSESDSPKAVNQAGFGKPGGIDHGQLLLGKATDYVFEYDPSLLCAIPRDSMRKILGVNQSELPFTGVDQWNAYEFSWLNPAGKPCVAIARFSVPANSPAMVESKSFKLYLNSFNQTRFDSLDMLRERLEQDLSRCVGASVSIILEPLDSVVWSDEQSIGSACLDDLEVEIHYYQPAAELLSLVPESELVQETVHSHLLRSMCPVTGQPDWGSVFVAYRGQAIDHASLLQYIISFRNCQEFHEQCVERMYVDIKRRCKPFELTVFAQYLRRGGLDINPFRTDCGAIAPANLRLPRQ